MRSIFTLFFSFIAICMLAIVLKIVDNEPNGISHIRKLIPRRKRLYSRRRVTD